PHGPGLVRVQRVGPLDRHSGPGGGDRAGSRRPGSRALRGDDDPDQLPSAVVDRGALCGARRAGLLVPAGGGPTRRIGRKRVMYGWIWRNLPGPTAVRVLLALILILAVVAVLFLWVFPALEPLIPFNEQTVGGSS